MGSGKTGIFDVAVVGGGASGMFASICAARSGADVCLIEAGSRLGTKILQTGNGRCNLTHFPISKENYSGSLSERAGVFFDRFSESDTLDLFKELGLLTRDRDGYVYPYSEQASAVLDVLRFSVDRLGIRVIYDTKVKKIETSADGFDIEGIRARKVIICSGGAAAPATGSDGSGEEIVRKLGIKTVKMLPALVKVKSSDPSLKELAGVRAKGSVRFCKDGTDTGLSDRGEIQFNKDGLSGIPVLNISRHISEYLDRTGGRGKAQIHIDLIPELSSEELTGMIVSRLERPDRPEETLEDALTGIIHKKLSLCAVKKAGRKPGDGLSFADERFISAYVDHVKDMIFDIDSVFGFDNAQVTCGGVISAEVDDNLQSVKCPGLYFAGEFLDIDGICGGYNLQWAWTSGYIAGTGAAGA